MSGPAHECAAGCGQPLTQWQRSEDNRVWHPKCVPPGLPLLGARRKPDERDVQAVDLQGGLL